MPYWLNWALLLLFSIHLLAFAWLYLRRRTAYHGVVSLTFVLLVILYALQLTLSREPVIAGLSLYWWLRIGAWTAALLSLVLWLRRRRHQRMGG